MIFEHLDWVCVELRRGEFSFRPVPAANIWRAGCC